MMRRSCSRRIASSRSSRLTSASLCRRMTTGYYPPQCAAQRKPRLCSLGVACWCAGLLRGERLPSGGGVRGAGGRACRDSRARRRGSRPATVDERALTVPWRGGQLRGRLYRPRGASDRAMLLVPGVHAAGVDEPRLVQFARDLAAVRHTVLTVGARRPHPVPHHPSNDRHDRGRGAVAVAAARARAGRPRRHDGHQLRGRPVDRRGVASRRSATASPS